MIRQFGTRRGTGKLEEYHEQKPIRILKSNTMRLFLISLLAVLPYASLTADDFKSIFNGQDLSGWVGKDNHWKVDSGVIKGETTKENPTKSNTFLIWEGGEVGDFIFKTLVRFSGNNSGVQYRSERMGDPSQFAVKGYQADLHPKPEYFGMLYAEKWRGIVAKRFQKVVVDNDGNAEVVGEVGDRNQNLTDWEWNELTIIAVGNRQIHQVNGVTTMDLIDNHPEAKRKGILALQLHAGAPMKVEFKDLRIKELNSDQGKEAIKPFVKNEGNLATPVDRISVADGFKVELLYSVPGDSQGSWVNLCADEKGRLIVSDQFGGLYRIQPPAANQVLGLEDIHEVPADIRAVNGMAWINKALYVGVNDYERKIPSGLYRITDSNDDDELDHVEVLREFEARGDHGVHAVVPSPDQDSLFLVTGNSTTMTEISDHSPVPRNWGEDHLLTSFPDGRGHNRGVLAPGGIIYQVDLEGKEFRAYANGFRNIFDAAFNRDGELFTYDADMEYDFNTPWYRPTRINHVVSGAEYGWRNGAGKRPTFYPDNLPATIDIGPGSPTGVTFGYGAKFPTRYQDALFALDWSWGKLYAIHLKDDGGSYKATKEEFLTGAPLPITDAIINPIDGAMYFTIGGRKVQSGLYRVTYVGTETTDESVKPQMINSAQKLRRRLESFHGKINPGALDAAWPHLANPDRYIRHAARIAIEHQPVESWIDRALVEEDDAIKVELLLALSRSTADCPLHANDGATSTDAVLRNKLIASFLDIDLDSITADQQITAYRAMQILLHRFAKPDAQTIESIIGKLDPRFPATTPELNWILCETLAWLQAPNTASKAIALIKDSPTQEEQMQYARSIRFLKTGWTKPLRIEYFNWFLKAANYRGGASFEKFIEFIRNDAVATLSPEQKESLKVVLAKEPEKKSALENLGEVFVDRKEKQWTLNELSNYTSEHLTNRDFNNGRKMFAASGCYACHRFNNQGGMTGPDLTTAGRRYSIRDLIDQVVNPSKVINDQFSAVKILTDDGRIHSGVIVNLGVRRDGDMLVLNTDLTDPNARVSIDRNTIEQLAISKTSPMPSGLFNRMTKPEIADLIAYLLSGGNPKDQMFKP